MTWIRRLANLGPLERRLLPRAVAWIVASRVGLRVLPYRTLSSLLEGASRRAPVSLPCSAENVNWALGAAARRLPGTQCLAWALACRSLLGQAGISSELRIGVARSAEGRLQAHAWVECGGTTFTWGDDERSYAPLASVLGRRP